jgi:hypothetical protein
MVELTQQQLQAIDSASGAPRLVDPRTNTAYVLLSEELYARIESLLNDDVDMRQVSVLVDRAMHDDDAGDPSLAFYQQKYGST